jgi:hypothetical protein
MEERLTLNIAGEKIDVVYDGKVVKEPFLDEPLHFYARCGHVVDQEVLVKICERQLAQRN